MDRNRDTRTIPGFTTLAVFAMLFGTAYLFVTGAFSAENSTSGEEVNLLNLSSSSLQFDYFVERPLDTLFVLDTCYLEVRIDSQIIFQHCKSGLTRKFLCSTGNKKINKAIETTEGIYCVQSKSPLAYSRQFDSTKMYFWVGFNGNIGFHGLDGKGYYRYLGKRPSSHGCIRMAREDAEWMFTYIPIGTPVFVHSGTAARCLAFLDTVPSRGVHLQSDNWIRRDLERQLRVCYRGRALLENPAPHYFQKSSLWWGGIPTGDINKLPAKQRQPVFTGDSRDLSLIDALHHAAR